MTDQNHKRLGQQRLGLFVVAIVLVALAALYVFSSSPNTNKTRADDLRRRQAMTDVINPTGITEDFLSGTGSRLQAVEEAVSRLEEQNQRLSESVTRKDNEIASLQADLEKTRDEAATMIADMATLVANTEVRSPNDIIQSDASINSPYANEESIVDPFSRENSNHEQNQTSNLENSLSPLDRVSPPAIKTISFDLTNADEEIPYTLSDKDKYVPANAYTTATVLVGVDMSAGIRLSADPKPILLRITSPAKSVTVEDTFTEIDLTGCLVNGSAHAELSSERVYVQLQKITCSSDNLIFESPVKGYIAQLGKVGVRGRVVSREGDVLSKALFSGILGGFGRGIARNTNRIFGSSSQDSASGFVPQERLTSREIATGGLGEGLATAADTVSEYLIERAEQYQPVIEMPTGIEVNIVFLSGFHLGES